MKIYNTLHRKIEEIKPINDRIVGVYTCGPTVYDHSHIGHWFNYVRMDLLIRTLQANKYKVDWVMNITDVGHLTSDADEGDDKIEQKARKEHRSAWEIAEFYTKEFIDTMELLNIQKPSKIVKATDHITDQINLIVKLEKLGYTYKIDGDGIYYDTSKFKDYSKFAYLDLDQQEAGKRFMPNPFKKNLADFALWKFSPKDRKRDMEWESPWGIGFPGWHIECSAMSMKYLGDTFDIHTGGIDHIPVHHTNEIAQSTAVTKKPLAHYWLHSNHVTVNNQKISKSLHNGITIEEIVEKGYSPEVIRMHILESHYQSQSKFSLDALYASARRLYELKSMAVLKYQPQNKIDDHTTFSFKETANEIINLMSNNLESPKVLAFLSEIANQVLATKLTEDMLPYFNDLIQTIDLLLGTKLGSVPDISTEIKELIQKRELLRKNKDYRSADLIRDKLLTYQVELKDLPNNNTIWNWAI